MAGSALLVIFGVSDGSVVECRGNVISARTAAHSGLMACPLCRSPTLALARRSAQLLSRHVHRLSCLLRSGAVGCGRELRVGVTSLFRTGRGASRRLSSETCTF